MYRYQYQLCQTKYNANMNYKYGQVALLFLTFTEARL